MNYNMTKVIMILPFVPKKHLWCTMNYDVLNKIYNELRYDQSDYDFVMMILFILCGIIIMLCQK